MNVLGLVTWMTKRNEIAVKKEAGKPKPWTDDKILRDFRFCNVYRENDSVTKWISAFWREPNASDPDLFFAMAVARLFNRIETLASMGYPLPWRPKSLKKFLTAQQEFGFTVFSAAYIVSTNGMKMGKIDYLFEHVLEPLWKRRDVVRPRKGDTLAEFSARLQGMHGFSGFMAGQVVADVKYVAPLRSAVDWDTWAVSGPGSRRGLNRVVGREKDAPWREQDWLRTLTELRAQVLPLLRVAKMQPVHAQDLQNCLCEFDKYERTRKGEGRPRNTYPGAK